MVLGSQNLELQGPAIQVDACLLEVFGCRVQAKRKKPRVDLVYLLTV